MKPGVAGAHGAAQRTETLVTSLSRGACLAAKLASTEEYIDGQFTGNLGEVLIRCA